MLAVFQHQTFCRFSDAEKIQLSDVFHDVDYFKITIRYSKTDQQGEGQFVYLPKSSSPYRNAHMLMCLYIEKMGFEGLASSTDLYLFPPLKWDPSKSEYFVVPGKPVSYSQALTCFKNLLKFANLDYSKYGMHSPRRGGTTDAFVNNVPEFIIDVQGRWKSHQSKYRYVKLTEKDVCKKLANATSYWFCVCRFWTFIYSFVWHFGHFSPPTVVWHFCHFLLVFIIFCESGSGFSYALLVGPYQLLWDVSIPITVRCIQANKYL